MVRLFLVCLLIVVNAIVYYLVFTYNPKPNYTWPPKYDTSRITPPPTPKPTPVPLWTLKYNNETLSNFSPHTNPDILHWNDFIIYPSEVETSGERPIIVYSHNLTTHQTFKLIDQTQDYSELKNLPTEFMGASIVENKLFISLGGYRQIGELYWTNYPPTSQASLITNKESNPGIQKIKNQYFIESGDGDGCGGFVSYSLLNLESMTVRKIADTHLGCIPGEEFIGIDTKNRFIMAGQNGELDYGPNFPNASYYEYLLAIPISSPNIKQGLIAKQDFPKKIISTTYNESTNQVILESTTQRYIFDLSSNKLLGPTSLSPATTPSPYPTRKPTLTPVDFIKSLNLPEDYSLTLE